MTILSMLALLCVYGFIVLYGVKYDEEKCEFFSANDSKMLKGLFCIIVVLVHVPQAYQNSIQDLIGSFAYIGVTFFFMTSAYGLRWGVEHKSGYLKGFWKKRLPSLLIPAILCNLLFFVSNYFLGESNSLISVIDINSWVKVLLLFYFVFWLVYFIGEKLQLHNNKIGLDLIISIIVVVLSIIGMFSPFKITILWPVESIGFAYGILLADYADNLVLYAKKKWVHKFFVLFAISLILGLSYIKFKNVPIFGDYLLRIVLGMILLILILHITTSFRFGNKAFGYLGRISYSVYLIHDYVFSYFEKMRLISNSGVYICVCVMMTLFLASGVNYVSNRIMQRIKNERMKQQ